MSDNSRTKIHGRTNEDTIAPEDEVVDKNDPVVKKNFLFGIMVAAQQIFMCFFYGFLIEIPPRTTSDITNYQNDFTPIALAFLTYMFVLVGTYGYNAGFGLLFSYNRELLFSGMGFTLLITCLTV